MEQKQFVEVTGEDVEAAIANGLAQLGVGPGDVIVEVLEEPSRGVFGIGAKQARVRLKLLRPPEPPKPVTEPEPPEASESVVETQADSDFQDDEDEYVDEKTALAMEDIGEDGRVGHEVLSEILEKMGLNFTINVYLAEPSRPNEDAPWLLDVTGGDLDGLIGRRGDTLASLQYITRLIASRRLQRRANIVVDVSGYKSKRSDRLRQLANRMADQAVAQGRTVSLEPMPPNERRIIHLTLRSRDDVSTKSAGEGNARKVMIIPQ